ncbi:MAG: SurA N-terminal domain-containing protein, partial [Gemmatimonadaceae bacterium]
MRKSATVLIALAATAAMALPVTGYAQAPAVATAASAQLIPLDRVVAVVGSDPIMESEVSEAIIQRQQQDPAFKLPTDSAGWATFQQNIINGLIDQRLLLQEAKDEKLSIPDSLLAPNVDAQIAKTRAQFPTEADYRSELVKAGLGTPDEYRQFLLQQMRDGQLQQEVTAKLQRDGKILPVSVSEQEVQQAFDGIKG